MADKVKLIRIRTFVFLYDTLYWFLIAKQISSTSIVLPYIASQAQTHLSICLPLYMLRSHFCSCKRTTSRGIARREFVCVNNKETLLRLHNI